METFAPRQRGNVLLIIADQWRADCFSCRGNPYVRTPNLDRLVREGCFFENAFTSSPLCSTARACLLTGQPGHVTGIIDNVGVGGSPQYPLRPTVRTWLDAARKADFRLGYFGRWHLGPDGPIKRGCHGYSSIGFERWATPKTSRHALATEDGELKPERRRERCPANVLPGAKPPFYGILKGGIEDSQCTDVVTEATEFLSRDDGRPWFLTVAFPGPHFPFYVPEPYASGVDPATIELPPTFTDNFQGKPWYQNRQWWSTHAVEDLTVEDRKQTAAMYYGFASMIDSLIPALLKAAEVTSVTRPLTVIFTSDHGEMLGAHGRLDKGPYMYEEALRFPIIIRGEGTPSGSVRSEYVNTLDLGTTLFALAGERVEQLAGRDLMPAVRNAVNPSEWLDQTVSGLDAFNGHSFVIRCIRTPYFKYCWNPQTFDELYDLERDPGEMVNISGVPAYRKIEYELRRRLFVHLWKQGDPVLQSWWALPQAGAYMHKSTADTNLAKAD